MFEKGLNVPASGRIYLPLNSIKGQVASFKKVKLFVKERCWFSADS